MRLHFHQTYEWLLGKSSGPAEGTNKLVSRCLSYNTPDKLTSNYYFQLVSAKLMQNIIVTSI